MVSFGPLPTSVGDSQLAHAYGTSSVRVITNMSPGLSALKSGIGSYNTTHPVNKLNIITVKVTIW